MQADARAAGMSGLQRPQHRPTFDSAADRHIRSHRLVGRAQPARMVDRDNRFTAHLTREHHDSGAGGEYRLSGGAREIDSAMAREPILRRFLETAHDGGTRLQRPAESGRGCGVRRGGAAVHGHHRRPQEKCRHPAHASHPRRNRGTWKDRFRRVWTTRKHVNRACSWQDVVSVPRSAGLAPWKGRSMIVCRDVADSITAASFAGAMRPRERQVAVRDSVPAPRLPRARSRSGS